MSQNHNYNLRTSRNINYKALHNIGDLSEISSNSSDTDNENNLTLIQENDTDNENNGTLIQENNTDLNEISNILTQLSLEAGNST